MPSLLHEVPVTRTLSIMSVRDANLPLPRATGHGLQGEIYDMLKEAIVTGALAPGERLLQLSLAEHFGTSQTPVREALRRLVQESLVEYVPRRGTYVRKPRLSEVEDVYSLRAELEVWAARRFVERASEQDRAALQEHLRGLTKAAAEDDYQRFVDADMRLHEAVCRGSGSSLLFEIWTSVDNRVRGLRAASRSATSRRYPGLVEQHRAIVEALLHGDPETGERLIREHMAAGPQDIPHAG